MARARLPFIIAVLAIAAIAGWWLWPEAGHDHQAGSMPPTAAGSPMVAVTLPDSLTAIAQDGKILFDRTCAACHGANAAGSGNGPPLVHKIYEPNHHGDQSFLLAARNGVRAHHWQFGNMPPQPEVSDAQVGTIVTYVRELQRANGIF
jgi:mono/diheme cytochrome c family protein